MSHVGGMPKAVRKRIYDNTKILQRQGKWTVIDPAELLDLLDQITALEKEVERLREEVRRRKEAAEAEYWYP